MKLRAQALAAVILLTAAALTVSASPEPLITDEAPFVNRNYNPATLTSDLDYVLTEPCGTGSGTSPTPWAQLVEFRCALQTLIGVETLAEVEAHQRFVMQNAIADGGFNLAPLGIVNDDDSQEAAYGWTADTDGTDDVVSFGNGEVALSNGGGVKQWLYAGALGDAGALGWYQGFDMLALDADGSGRVILKMMDVNGDEVTLTWDLADEVGRVHLTPDNAVVTGQEDIQSCPTSFEDCDFFQNALLSYLSIYSSSGSLIVDNVVIDGTGFPGSLGAVVEYDDDNTFSGSDAFTHDGHSVVIVPYDVSGIDFAAPGDSEPVVSFWMAAIEHSPSGASFVPAADVVHYAANIGAPGDAGEEDPDANNDRSAYGSPVAGTQALGDGAIGAVYATLWAGQSEGFATAAAQEGFVFHVPLEQAFGQPIWGNVKFAAQAEEPVDRMYQHESADLYNNGGEFSISVSGYLNEKKIVQPFSASNDVTEAASSPWHGPSFAAIAAAGGAVAGSEYALDQILAQLFGCNGLCDLNDGWFHVIRPQNAVELGDEVIVTEDAMGDFVFHHQVYYIDSGTGDLEQLSLEPSANPDIDNLVLGGYLGFKTPSQGTGALDDGVLSHGASEYTPDGKTSVYRFSYDQLEAAGIIIGGGGPGDAIIIEPASVWAGIWYDPEAKNGVQDRAGLVAYDHADYAACQASYYDCPISQGAFSSFKNALIDNAVELDENPDYRDGMRAFVDMFEYHFTGTTGIANSDANHYMMVNAPAYPDCSTGDCLTQSSPESRYNLLHPSAGGSFSFVASPRLATGGPAGDPASSDVSEVTFDFAQFDDAPSEGPAPDRLVFSSTSQPRSGSKIVTTSDFVAGAGLHGDGGYHLAFSELEFAQQVALTDNPGDEHVFYLYTYADSPGKAGSYSWQKEVAGAQDQHIVANAINNFGNALKFVVPGPGIEEIGGQVAEIGGSTDFAIDVSNLGAFEDAFDLSVSHSNTGLLVDVTLDKANTGALSAGAAESVTVTVDASNIPNFVSGLNTEVTLTADNNRGFLASYTFNVDISDLAPTVEVSSGGEFFPQDGENGTAQITVTNNRQKAEAYSLTYSVDSNAMDWDIEFGPTQTNLLENGGSEIVEITADYLGSIDGATLQVTVTATALDPTTSLESSNTHQFQAGIYVDGDFELRLRHESYYSSAAVDGALRNTCDADCPSWPYHLPTTVPVHVLTTQGQEDQTSALAVFAEVYNARRDYIEEMGTNGRFQYVDTAVGDPFVTLTHSHSQDTLALLVQGDNPPARQENVAAFVYDTMIGAYNDETNATETVRGYNMITGDPVDYEDGLAWLEAHPGPLTMSASLTYHGFDLSSDLVTEFGGLLVVPDAEDSDGDGYSNIVEMRSFSSPLNRYSTPYTDDDGDGDANVRDNLPFVNADEPGATPENFVSWLGVDPLAFVTGLVDPATVTGDADEAPDTVVETAEETAEPVIGAATSLATGL